MADGRLERQFAFLAEADSLKTVLRRSPLNDGSRSENSAEHSWHLAVTALVLAEYAAPNVNVPHALALIAIHDLVEIDAGDTFAYDATAQATRVFRERSAAERVFGVLPTDQTPQLRALWEEFEDGATPEARFANAVDRLQPLLQDIHAGGGTCRNQTRFEVLQRMAPVETALPRVWPAVLEAIDAFSAAGVLRPSA
jgi:putative hydrolase of HD superfamily